MTTSGLAESTAARTAGASRPSATTGSAPIRLTATAFIAVRVMPVTEYPAATNARTSSRPTAPVAPATKIRMLSSFCLPPSMIDAGRQIVGSDANSSGRMWRPDKEGGPRSMEVGVGAMTPEPDAQCDCPDRNELPFRASPSRAAHSVLFGLLVWRKWKVTLRVHSVVPE